MKFENLVFVLQLAGVITLAIGIGHTLFYRIFGWKDDFARIGLLNAKIFMTIHIATTLLLLGLGVLTIRFASELSSPTDTAKIICFTLALFWLWRLVWQIVYFKPSRIKPERNLLVLHYVLIGMFGMLTTCYAAPLLAGT